MKARRDGQLAGSVVIYGRVSSKEQEEEGFSLPAQMRLLRDYADRKGFKVLEEFVEAETAKTAGRKAFDQMLRFLRERPGTAILVEKTDRLYRNFADFVKVDELGPELHFVKEGQVISPDSHSSEKLMHSIKVCLAKNYVDNLSEEIRKGMREKALQGIYPSHAPLGYRNEMVQGRKVIVPDAERAPLIRQLFEEFAVGRASVRNLAKRAAEVGLRTRRGRSLCKSQVHRLLKDEVYAGKIAWGSIYVDGIHEPLIGKDLFFRVQAILEGRTSRRGYGSVPIAYRGLVVCSKCGCLYVGEIKKRKYTYYHCAGRQSGCDAPYVREERLTEFFASELEGIAIPYEIAQEIETYLREMADVEVESIKARRKQLDREVATAKERLASIYEDKLSGEVSVETYRTLRTRYEAQLAEAEAAIRHLVSPNPLSSPDTAEILELLASAGDRFKQAQPDQRREIIQILYSNSKFDGDKLVVEPHDEYDLMLKAAQTTNRELALVGSDGGQIEEWWR